MVARILRLLGGVCWIGLIALAMPFPIRTATAGTVEVTAPTDFTFDLAEPSILVVRTFAEQYGIDSMLWLYTSSGNLVAENDDWFGLDSYLEVTLEAGSYRLRAGVCCGNPDAWYGTAYVLDSNLEPVPPATTTTTTTTTSTTTTVLESTTTYTEESTTTEAGSSTTAVETVPPETDPTTVETTQPEPSIPPSRPDRPKPEPEPEPSSPPETTPETTPETMPELEPTPAATLPEAPTETSPPTAPIEAPESPLEAPESPAPTEEAPTDPPAETEPPSPEPKPEPEPVAPSPGNLTGASLATLDDEELASLLDDIETGDFTDEQLANIANAMTNASDEIRTLFEQEVNIFDGRFDSYIPLGSQITVGQRRAMVAVTAGVALPAAAPRRRTL